MINLNSGNEFLRVLEALSNPYRLKILAILFEESQYVSQLARRLGISRPLLYLHLQKLEEVNLVKSHMEISETGKAMRYYEANLFQIEINNAIIQNFAPSITLKKRKEE
ncbi:winged helix-turn-helix domain-containing protein [Viridibacillus sp. FSL H8-0123]|uniref:ArsR/SmtB family transcription factor n=1 Tax=Viridibacillus sp. FSL H8-0123 TaxID=1928922 RepID=UPI00096F77C5|nr:winged helix-turn-helix domain-containing protein [Viridibacillus sp. FSL H8-0123]OMC83372.1 transcriptional regulator [Viridibacillus sp. FSL H8-0123]